MKHPLLYFKEYLARFQSEYIVGGGSGPGPGPGPGDTPTHTVQANARLGRFGGTEDEAVLLTISGLTMPKPTETNGRDAERHDFDIRWSRVSGPAEEPGTWTAISGTYSTWNNRAIAFGPEAFVVPQAAGDHTWRVEIRDPSNGNYAFDDVTFTVQSKEQTFAEADRFCVGTDFTDAPAHPVGQRYSTIAAAISAAQGRSNPVWISVEAGRNFNIGSAINPPTQMNTGVRFDTFGTGKATFTATAAMTAIWQIAFSFGGMMILKDFINVGGWDAATENDSLAGSNADPVQVTVGMRFPFVEPAQYTVVNCEARGVGQCVSSPFCENSNATNFLVFENNIWDNWQNYGIFTNVSKNNDGSGSNRYDLAVVGTSILQKQDALMGGSGPPPARTDDEWNNHGPMRVDGNGILYIDGIDARCRNGWFINASKPSIQPFLRCFHEGNDDNRGGVYRVRAEGGVECITHAPQSSSYPKKQLPLVIAHCHFVGGAPSWRIIRSAHGGLVVRNCLMVKADTGQVNLDWQEFIAVDFDLNGASGEPAGSVLRASFQRYFNNTFVDLRSGALSIAVFKDDTGGGGATNVELGNNISYAPNFNSPVVPTSGAMSRSNPSTWFDLFEGIRWTNSAANPSTQAFDPSLATPANTTDLFSLGGEEGVDVGDRFSEFDMLLNRREGTRSKGALEFV